MSDQRRHPATLRRSVEVHSRGSAEWAPAATPWRPADQEELPRTVYERGRLRIDFDAYEVWVDGHPVRMVRREFQLLRFFVRAANRVFDRTQILARVWPEAHVTAHTVDVHVHRLRRCIEVDPEHPALIVTVRGVGWKFDERAL